MNKLFALVLLFAISFTTKAQLGGLGKKFKDKVAQRVDAKIDKAMEKTLDEIEHPSTKSKDPEKQTDLKSENLKAYSKYDFRSGEKVLYSEDFLAEAIGELPLGWNTNGTGEVVKLEQLKSNWLRLHGPFMYLSANNSALPENFTAEFDLILQLKNNGWMYPSFQVGFLASSEEAATANTFFSSREKYEALYAEIFPAENKGSRILLESFADAKQYFKSEPKSFAVLENFYGLPIHVAIQVQKERFRMWVNAEKVFDVPKALALKYKLNQLFFKLSSTNYNDEQYGVYVSNIRLATGVPDLRHKLLDEGVFTTNAILFDPNSALVKSESTGIIKDIAAVLKEHPELKIRITGYTSSDGDDSKNLELSKKRAEAVKAILVDEFSIESSSIETDGKGEKDPIADNTTKEGRFLNRRVVFSKI